MATVTSYTSDALDSLFAGKADLVGGVVPDAQAPAITMKKDSWVVDLSDHGGVGDGTTPDDAAWTSAMSAINPTWGGKIVVRAGSFLMSGSTAIQLASFGITIEGAGCEATKIVIGSGFSAAQVIKITGNDCRVKDLSIVGANSATTSNPVCDGIDVSSAQRAKIENCNFWYVNGWAVQVIAGATTGLNPSGSMINKAVIRSCAGGIRIFGNAGSGSASMFLTDIQNVACGVGTGSSANLDGIDLEDAWNVNCENVISWMTAGNGSAFHLKGNCISNYFRSSDAEGSAGGPAVLIEDGTNGSPYNTQFQGGTIQLGSIGLRITGAAKILHLESVNVVNNKTHGISVEGTGNPIYCHDVYFTANGAGATGTNYDINWSGSSVGTLSDCRFESAITASGTAGVQKTINVASGQNVRCLNTQFSGTGALSSNYFTNVPNSVLDTTSGSFNFLTSIALAVGAIVKGNLSLQPSASTNTVMSSNIGGTATNDTWRLTGDGTIAIGAAAGTGTRDTSWGRQGVAEIGTADSDIIIALAGKGLRVKEGTNARMGTVTLAAGSGTVTNSSITANTRIFLGYHTVNASPGALFCHAITIGTGFVVNSTSASDTGVVSYLLVEAA